MSSIRLFEKKVVDYLSSILDGSEPHIMVGCSGGPDSTALLYALNESKSEYPLELSCVYLDHGIRDPQEISEEISHLEELTASLAIPIIVRRAGPNELRMIARQGGRSLEEVAREWRYRKLHTIRREIEADYIAVAHHIDDQVETIVMRFFQGVDVTGMAGIPPLRQHIIRPLIHCEREEILSYLQNRSLTYKMDSSNREDAFLRNRIRGRIIPQLADIFPGYKKTLIAFGEKMARVRNFLMEEAKTRLAWAKIEEKGEVYYRIRGTDFLAAPGIIRLQSLFILYDLLNAGTTGSGRLPYRFLSPVLKDAWFFPKRTLLTGHGIQLLWKGDFLLWNRDVVYDNKKGYLVAVQRNHTYTVEDAGLRISVSSGQQAKSGEGLFTAALGHLAPPVIVRSRRAGDRMAISGGTKSLKKMLSEWKVAAQKRGIVPIVADRERVLAVMGQSLGYKNRFVCGIDKGQRGATYLTIEITRLS
jgi:tRNA(Ile)-lysidine synthase